MNRTQRAHDRAALIADLDTARAEVNDLRAGIHALIDDLETSGGARLEDICERLQALAGPPRIARELHLVDNYEPRTGLHLIRQRTGGGTA